MSFSYTKLWVLLAQRRMTKEELRVGAKLSSATIARMGQDVNVSLDVLDKICEFLQCRLEDIIERLPNKE